MAHTLRHNFHIRDIRTLIHWIKGVYLIVYVVNEDASDGTDCIIGVNLTRPLEDAELPPQMRAITDDIMAVVPDNKIQVLPAR
jgi:hypothetical protein